MTWIVQNCCSVSVLFSGIGYGWEDVRCNYSYLALCQTDYWSTFLWLDWITRRGCFLLVSVWFCHTTTGSTHKFLFRWKFVTINGFPLTQIIDVAGVVYCWCEDRRPIAGQQQSGVGGKKTSSGWAIMRRFVGNNLEMVLVIILLVVGNFSVQGARLQPDGQLVEGTIGKQVSAT